jgi:hypothetical protein
MRPAFQPRSAGLPENPKPGSGLCGDAGGADERGHHADSRKLPLRQDHLQPWCGADRGDRVQLLDLPPPRLSARRLRAGAVPPRDLARRHRRLYLRQARHPAPVLQDMRGARHSPRAPGPMASRWSWSISAAPTSTFRQSGSHSSMAPACSDAEARTPARPELGGTRMQKIIPFLWFDDQAEEARCVITCRSSRTRRSWG